MPTNEPSSAPDQVPAISGEETSVAAVLTDEQLDDAPGGGGLGGAAAAATPTRSGGTPGAESPNHPASPPAVSPYPADDATREAALEAIENPPAEAHPSSL